MVGSAVDRLFFFLIFGPDGESNFALTATMLDSNYRDQGPTY